jgi:hypothetical protein
LGRPTFTEVTDATRRSSQAGPRSTKIVRHLSYRVVAIRGVHDKDGREPPTKEQP